MHQGGTAGVLGEASHLQPELEPEQVAVNSNGRCGEKGRAGEAGEVLSSVFIKMGS